jgi:EmrB/QacA subfamily drug resistance transporter
MQRQVARQERSDILRVHRSGEVVALAASARTAASSAGKVVWTVVSWSCTPSRLLRPESEPFLDQRLWDSLQAGQRGTNEGKEQVVAGTEHNGSSAGPTGAGGAVAAEQIHYGSARGWWVLVATIGGSSIAFLDSTVVNVALPVLGDDLGATVAGLQWVLNGYMLALASLIMLAGALGDRYGRRRIFLVGVVWFAVASLLCAVAQNVAQLVAARVLQGIGGALLTPGSLAIIQASFVAEDRGKAIGAWSGIGALAGALGPFIGGSLVDGVGWRWVFLINVPLAALVIAVAARHVPESRDPTSPTRLDVVGAITCGLGLGGVTYALIAAGDRGFGAAVALAGVVGVLAIVAFVVVERRSRHPMLPLDIFSSPQFTWTNVVTFAVYGGMGAVFFLLVVQLQTVLGYTALQAGVASLPVTVLLFVLSPRAGALAQRAGPRLPMTLGPIVAGAGIILLTRVQEGATYLTSVFPAVVVFGVGLGLTVAPLTTTVLAAAADRHSGIASGVNNAVARAAQLLAVAVLPVAVGLTGNAYSDPSVFAGGFTRAMLISGGLVIAGGVLAFFVISPVLARPEAPPERPAAVRKAVAVVGAHCDMHGPPLRHGAGRSGELHG